MEKFRFASPYVNPPVSDSVPTGEKIDNEYILEVHPVTRESYLKKTGEVNRYDEIQAHHDLVNLKALIRRYNDGDVTAIGDPNAVQGANALLYPENLIEANDLINRFKAMYYNNPEFVEKYKDFETFIQKHDFKPKEKEAAAAAAEKPKGSEVQSNGNEHNPATG